MLNNYRGHPRSAHIQQAQKSNLKLVTDAPNSSPLPFQYFADQSNRWPFFTGEMGKSMLEFMDIHRQRALLLCDEQIDVRLDHEGRDIYKRKPNKNESVVTWSQNDYSHVGFQRRYIELKSVQRFTEMYSFLERAMLCGALDKWIKRPANAQNVGSSAEMQGSAESSSDVSETRLVKQTETQEGGSEMTDSSIAHPSLPVGEVVIPGVAVHDNGQDKDESTPKDVPRGTNETGSDHGQHDEAKTSILSGEQEKATNIAPVLTPQQTEPLKKTIRIVSIGGGPGFELIACKAFFKKHAPDVVVDVITLDYMSGWRVYNELFNIEFHEYDMLASQPDLDSLIGDREVDIYLFSYVFFHYFRLNEHLEKILGLMKPHPKTGESPAVYILERSENMNTLDRIVDLSNVVHVEESTQRQDDVESEKPPQDGGDHDNSKSDVVKITQRIPVSVLKVIDQKLGRDDRQCIIMAASEAQKTTAWPLQFEPTFPNVPYEEHKLKAKQSWGGSKKSHNNNFNYSRDQNHRQQHNYQSSRGRYDNRRYGGNAPMHQDMGGYDSNVRHIDDSYGRRSSRGRSRSRGRDRGDRYSDRDRESKRSSSRNRDRGRQRDSENSRSRSRSRSRDRSSRSSRSSKRRHSKSRSRSRSESRSRSQSRSRSRSKSRSSRRKYRSRSRDRSRSRSRERTKYKRRSRSASRDRRERAKENSEGKETQLE